MEFILNHKKYSIINHELYINYLMVDSYFKDYSLYDYNIHFDFLDSILSKEQIEFDDILEGTNDLEELIEREEINFLPPSIVINEHLNGNFQIRYQYLEFSNIRVGEAIPLLIALSTLLDYKPILSLSQIEEELGHFIEKFRTYSDEK